MFLDEHIVVSQLRQLADELKVPFNGAGIRLDRNHCEFEINLYPPAIVCGVKPMITIPARLELKTSATFYNSFLVRKNHFIDWLADHVLFQHDFQTGTVDFDDKFFISVENVDWAHKFFNIDVISCISDILTQGFDRVFSSAQEIKADKIVPTIDQCPSIGDIEDVINRLSLLSAAANKL